MRGLVRATLALYPAAVRERYGQEVSDLLASSPTPLRDVADVAWCALTERMEHTYMVAAEKVRWWLALLIPAAGLIATMFYQPAWYPYLLPLSLLMIAAMGGVWLGGRGGPRWYQHPLAALGFISLAWLVPFENTGIRLIAYICWLAGAMALTYGVYRVRRRQLRVAALTGGVLGGLLLLEAMTIGLVAWLSQLTGKTPASKMWLWSWEALGSGVVNAYEPVAGQEAPFYQVQFFVPMPLLTPCLVFVISYAYVAAGKHARQHAQVE
jgi:hypothetical protein